MVMICFDLEGPLSGQDNAYDVMALAENGDAIFEALSEYDDILALEGKAGYEPGDTLKLVVPFFLSHGITEKDIRRVSKEAELVNGMKETIGWLKDRSVPVRIISTSYQQHAFSIGERLGVPEEDIASTILSLQKIKLSRNVLMELKELENIILGEGLSDKTKAVLDEIYFNKGLFDSIDIQVVGGQRKVEALTRFATEKGIDISEVASVGDSITDFKMLKKVREAGGLAIAFNANQYCLPHADIAVATLDGRALLPIFDAFISGGREEALGLGAELEESLDPLKPEFGFLKDLKTRPQYTLINGKRDLQDILLAHKKMRMTVRGEAGKLG